MEIEDLASDIYNQIRDIASKIYDNDEDREEGITAVVLVRDEPWFEPSVFSVSEIADEIVIVDASTVDISDTIEKFRNAGLNIKYEQSEPPWPKQLHIALNLSTKKWIMRWDADMIAYTSGKRDIKYLKDYIEKLDPNTYYAIEYKHFVVDNDFFHNYELHHHEPYLLNYYSSINNEKNLFRQLINFYREYFTDDRPHRNFIYPLPLYFKEIELDRTFGLHIKNIKGDRRRKERKGPQRVWPLLSDKVKKEKYSNSFEKFVEDYDYPDPDQSKELKSFDYDHPSILKKYIKEELGVEMKPTEEFKIAVEDHVDKWP